MPPPKQSRRQRVVISQHSDDSYDTTTDVCASSSESFERLRPAKKHSKPDTYRIAESRPVTYTMPSTTSLGTVDDQDDGEPDTSVKIIADFDDTEDNEMSEDSQDSDDGYGEDDYIFNDRDAIPPALPAYAPSLTSPSPVRPTTPRTFGRLFPSLDRLSVRHDELTADGNMNLRVDTVVPYAASGPGRRHPVAMQLFHLRMKDLGRREFSLRRYCRDSGREVCNTKRSFAECSDSIARPGLQRSVSSAIRSVKTPFHRTSTASSILKRPSTGRASGSSGSSSSSSARDDTSIRSRYPANKGFAKPLEPTDTMRLEFSNYARVDVTRKEHHETTRYDFEWWGHDYAWRKVVDENVGVASFHLFRDEKSSPIAHIVPESRSPSQLRMDEYSGGWVPPCFMWISDESILDAITDVADVIIASGLIALVDDSIIQRWRLPKPQRRPVTATSSTFSGTSPRNLIPRIFSRKHSTVYPHSSIKYSRAVTAY